MTAPAPYWNLVDEPWIEVLDTRGRISTESLRSVFHRADEIATIAGELPTQGFALLRMLLAVLRRAAGAPKDVERWRACRDDWDGVLSDVDDYLDELHDRFWLLHETHPFMQVADLRTSRDEVFGLGRIVCDGAGGSVFLTTRLGAALETAPWPEAARWLVHAQAFDVAGIHTGAVGDPRVAGGKGYGIGVGWAGALGGVWVEGDTLRETLLLNHVAIDDVDDDVDLPVWERAPLTAAPEGWHADDNPKTTLYRQPTGPSDLFTWPSRRIRLFGDAERATGVINAQGDRMLPQNRHLLEPMSAWRYSEPQSKALGIDAYMPKKHIPARSLWRGLDSLLPGTAPLMRADGPRARIEPRVVDWVGSLRDAGAVEEGLLRIRAAGIEYGSNDSVYAEIVHDVVEVPAALLVPQHAAMAAMAADAAGSADAAVRALGNLATNLALAAGASTESTSARDEISAIAYASLDGPFRAWLRTLHADIEPAERRAAWQREAHDLIMTLAGEAIAAAGPAALVGRVARGRHVDAGVAEHWFRAALRTALPHAFDPLPEADSEEVAA